MRCFVFSPMSELGGFFCFDRLVEKCGYFLPLCPTTWSSVCSTTWVDQMGGALNRTRYVYDTDFIPRSSDQNLLISRTWNFVAKPERCHRSSMSLEDLERFSGLGREGKWCKRWICDEKGSIDGCVKKKKRDIFCSQRATIKVEIAMRINVRDIITSRSNFLATPALSAIHAVPSFTIRSRALACKRIGSPKVLIRSDLLFLAFQKTNRSVLEFFSPLSSKSR